MLVRLVPIPFGGSALRVLQNIGPGLEFFISASADFEKLMKKRSHNNHIQTSEIQDYNDHPIFTSHYSLNKWIGQVGTVCFDEIFYSGLSYLYKKKLIKTISFLEALLNANRT